MKDNTSQTLSGNETFSSYLPGPHGLIREKMIRLKSWFTYWIWKRKIKRHLDMQVEDKDYLQFLDIGCGPGNFICWLERWFPYAKITAVDYEPELVKYAAKRVERTHVSISSAEKLAGKDSMFDVVSCFHVIEHLTTPEKFFSEASRVLKKNGLLLIATPNPEGFAARVLGENWNGIREDHISLQIPKLWRKALKQNGFDILDEGTTLFNGVPLLGSLPLVLPFQFLQAIFGWFPWKYGASYMVIAKKKL